MESNTSRFQWTINERTKRNKTIDYFVDIGVYMVLICNFFILWGNSQDIDVIVSWPTRLMVSYIFLLAIYIFGTNLIGNKVEWIEALFVGLVTITAVCYIFTCKSALLGKLVQYMCFLMLPGCCVLYKHAGRIRELKKAIYIANVFYALLLITLAFADNSHTAWDFYGEREIEELTLGYENPNETAMYLMLTCFCLVAAFFTTSKRIEKVVSGVLAVQIFYMVLQTRSRTCIVLCAVFLILTLVQNRFRIGRKMLNVAVFLPAAVLLVMMQFPQWIASLRFMGEVADTGRIIIFTSFFKEWNLGTALLGDFLRYGGENLHNSFLSLMGMFGIPAAIYYMYFLHKSTTAYSKNVQTKVAYLGYVSWIMVIIHGIAEGALLVAGTVYAGMVSSLLILMLPEEKTE